ncbi:hypothetical protein FN846DRAFT_310968 [Sphaerosporella brunnea]|uniref:C3H1-type domain-containing protein n=1 Tax=Sphaerosporella brunnea TaxID=1250544 RepID=A0A5J5F7N9_9PEZI|nr:hypothetical protein FN846DRAFT_310968 [Sphaerosporella brunnea]
MTFGERPGEGSGGRSGRGGAEQRGGRGGGEQRGGGASRGGGEARGGGAPRGGGRGGSGGSRGRGRAGGGGDLCRLYDTPQGCRFADSCKMRHGHTVELERAADLVCGAESKSKGRHMQGYNNLLHSMYSHFCLYLFYCFCLFASRQNSSRTSKIEGTNFSGVMYIRDTLTARAQVG